MRQPVHPSRGGAIRHMQIFLFANREIHLHWIHLRNRGKYASRADQIPDLDGRNTSDAINEGKDFRVTQIQRGLFDRSLIRLDCCFRREECLRVCVELALRNCVRFGLRDVTLHVNFSVGSTSLSLSELSICLIKYGLKRARIDFEKNLALSDEGPFVIVLANQVAAHLRRDLRVDVAFERPYPLTLSRYVLLDDACYFDCRWLR